MTLYSLVAISIGLLFPACRLFGDEASDPRQRFLLSAPDHKVGEDRYFYVIGSVSRGQVSYVDKTPTAAGAIRGVRGRVSIIDR